MADDFVEKGWAGQDPLPVVADYGETTSSFSWQDARAELLERPRPSGFNLAALAVDRHAEGDRALETALHWKGLGDVERKLDYRELRVETNRFANVLEDLGVSAGEAVFTMLGRRPALYVAALGTLKHRNVFCPIFSAFGPEPACQRLTLGRGRVLVTTAKIYRRVIEKARKDLPDLEHVLLLDSDQEIPGTHSYEELIGGASDDFDVPETDPEDPAILHFTSGTTGKPKGVVHVHDAAVAHFATSRFALDLRPGDVFWCTADPGWVTGTSYGIMAPLLHGARNLILEQEFDGEQWYRTIQDERVEVWYTSPTAIRMLMRLGPELASQFDLSSLRLVASVGEPLNPDAVGWGQEVLGLPILDNWWQTETGGIMIGNLRDQEIRPGSMGRPLPGVEARIVRRRTDGGLDLLDEPNTEGEIALKEGWPSMMRTYLDQQERYEECFRDGWYLSDDLAMKDEDGFFWFLGRADDMIKTAGHRIGPFEIESVLTEHPAVAEAAAVGKPDSTAGEIVKAFVALKNGVEATEDLKKELLGVARKQLGSVSAPREIEFVDELPKNRSGKIVRRILRAKESGEEIGDTSTLERGSAFVSGRGVEDEPGETEAIGDAKEEERADVFEASEVTEKVEAERALGFLRTMKLIRRFEEKSAELYADQKIRGFLHLYIGEEAVATGVMDALEEQDRIVATYREHGHALARGVPAGAAMAELMGRVDGCSGGRGGSMHLFHAPTNFYGGWAIVGGGLPIAVGLGLAAKMQDRPEVIACFFGEGAIAEGEFHEAMNLAALWQLPVLFCCENNGYAMGTALARSESQTDLCLKAAAYQMPAWPVDGMDVLAVAEAAQRAVLSIRGGGGPVFLEFQTYRFRAHSMFDPELYRDKEEVERWRKHGPITRLVDTLRRQGDLDDETLSEMDAEAERCVDEAVAFAEASETESPATLSRFLTSEETAP